MKTKYLQETIIFGIIFPLLFLIMGIALTNSQKINNETIAITALMSIISAIVCYKYGMDYSHKIEWKGKK
jgi:hypothetical protein